MLKSISQPAFILDFLITYTDFVVLRSKIKYLLLDSHSK